MKKKAIFSAGVISCATAMSGCAFLPIAGRVPANPPAIFSTDVKAPKEAMVPVTGNPSQTVKKNFPSDWQILLDAEVAMRTNDDETTRRTYLSSGFDVSVQLCAAWLDILINAQRDVEFGHGVASTLGTLTTTLMAAFDSATNEIAAASATFSATNATYELSKATFLFTPDLNVVKSKIEDAQRDYRETVTDASIRNFGEAEAAVQRHHQICSSSMIQELIQTAVIKARYSVDLPGKLSEITKARIDLESSELNRLVTNIALPIQLDVLKRLYFAVFHKDVFDPKQLDDFEMSLYEKINGQAELMNRLQGIGALGEFEKKVPQVAPPVIPQDPAFRLRFDEQVRDEAGGEARISIVTQP